MKTLALFFAAVLVAVTVGSASAAPSGQKVIGLSTDGHHWASALSHPLFNSSYRWVPGDKQTATLYVRNQSGEAASLRVELVSGTLRDAVLNHVFTVSTSVDGRKWVRTTPPGPHLMVSLGRVAAGSVHKIRILVAMSRSATNQSQHRRFALNFKVSLSQLPGSRSGSLTGSGTKIPGLPDTGSPITPALLAAVLFCLLSGAALIRHSRKPQTNERRP